ncbi:MAG: EutN/CcmL family microcompartment protein [Pirellulales bacterium]|nr:EutN/CcmL family microcompartment protein [Pirellulales bacterium]
MFVGKVTGQVIATKKTDVMTGRKLLLVEPYVLGRENRETLKTTGRTFVAVDTVGAGEGEFVLVVQGSSARLTPETKPLPVDCAIVGIVDSVRAENRCVYSKDGVADE